jgi:CubicO group peptidase (beta-lactamase class C family)
MPDLLTADGLARFSAAAAAHVGDETVPGLVALVARGDQVHAEALGSLSIGGPAVQHDSLFRIASTTKPVTGAATLALVGEGLLDLDEPVSRLLPELAEPRVLRRMDGPLGDTVPARRPITVRDLLTFTFGFGPGRAGWPPGPGPQYCPAGNGSLRPQARAVRREMVRTPPSLPG